MAATPIDLSNAVRKALEDIYRKKVNPDTEIQPDIFRGFLDTFDLAASEGLKDKPDVGYDFRRQILHNNEVFSAFKVHRMQNDIAAKMLDDKGELKTFAQFAEDVKGITSHQCRQWLRTEYDTAVKRAAQAADWRRFEDEKDVLPNLRWVPSTAANPEPFHESLWDTVLPVDHPFWSRHRPGDHWGCQCSLEATDDPAKATPTPGAPASPGLDNNPGRDGKLFSDSHPYFPDDCRTCPFYGGAGNDRPTNRTKDCYHCRYIEKVIAGGKVETEGIPAKYEDFGLGWKKEFKKGDGYLVTEEARIPSETQKHEWAKYQKEHAMCRTFAKAGHRIVFLRERPGMYDVLCDGLPADLKRTSSHNNIEKYGKYAVRSQHAQTILFQLDEDNVRTRLKLQNLKSLGVKVYYYFTGKEKEVLSL